MPGALQREIKQSKPFRSLQAEAFLNIQKTADALSQAMDAELKPHGISQTQYNVLRILRGAEPDGLPCREIAARMVAHDPDITRLLDRLETRNFVVRTREEKDRRVILTRITRAGLQLLDELDEPLYALLDRLLGHLGIQKLKNLIELLELARAS